MERLLTINLTLMGPEAEVMNEGTTPEPEATGEETAEAAAE